MQCSSRTWVSGGVSEAIHYQGPILVGEEMRTVVGAPSVSYAPSVSRNSASVMRGSVVRGSVVRPMGPASYVRASDREGSFAHGSTHGSLAQVPGGPMPATTRYVDMDQVVPGHATSHYTTAPAHLMEDAQPLGRTYVPLDPHLATEYARGTMGRAPEMQEVF